MAMRPTKKAKQKTVKPKKTKASFREPPDTTAKYRAEQSENGHRLWGFLQQHGFDLRAGPDELTRTAIWETETNTYLPGTEVLVESYKDTGEPAPAVILKQCWDIIKTLGTPIAAIKAKYEAAEQKIKEGLGLMRRSCWTFGDSINEIKKLHQRMFARTLTNEEITNKYQCGLTPQRIGQIAETSRYYPAEYRDESIDFRTYEEARKSNDKKGIQKLPVDKLLSVIKTTPIASALKEKLAEPKKAKPESHVMLLRVVITKVKDKWTIAGRPTFDGKYFKVGDWSEKCIEYARGIMKE